jgi:hypothetical protein
VPSALNDFPHRKMPHVFMEISNMAISLPLYNVLLSDESNAKTCFVIPWRLALKRIVNRVGYSS